MASRRAKTAGHVVYRHAREKSGVTARRKGRVTTLEFGDGMSRAALEAALARYLNDRFRG